MESVDGEAQVIVALSWPGSRGRTCRLGSWFKILPTRDFQSCGVCHIKDFRGMLPQGTFWGDCHIGLSWSVATWVNRHRQCSHNSGAEGVGSKNQP